MSLILGMTTSSEKCGLALKRNCALLSTVEFSGARSCVEELSPRIKSILDENKLSLSDLDAIGVDIGPGGMTGLKIGVVTAKTLAQAVGVALVPVSAPLALCAGLRHAGALQSSGAAIVLTVIKCSKSEYYISMREANDDFGLFAKDQLVGADGLRDIIRSAGGKKIIAVGDAAEAAAAVISELAPESEIISGELNFPTASIVCDLAAASEKVPFNSLAPNYLCHSYAERSHGIKV